MVLLFSERHTGYKVGVALFCIGVVAFSVGFATPYWTTIKIEDVVGYNGLWIACGDFVQHGTSCKSMTTTSPSTGTWFGAVQTLQCLALIGFVFAGCYAIFANWCAKSRVVVRYLECIMGLSAVLGLIGALLYAAEQAKMKEKYDNVRQDNGNPSFGFHPVAWSFIVDIIGCIFTVIAVILIAVFNKPLSADTPSMTFHPVTPGITVAPGSTSANAASGPAATPYRIITHTGPVFATKVGQ